MKAEDGWQSRPQGPPPCRSGAPSALFCLQTQTPAATGAASLQLPLPPTRLLTRASHSTTLSLTATTTSTTLPRSTPTASGNLSHSLLRYSKPSAITTPIANTDILTWTTTSLHIHRTLKRSSSLYHGGQRGQGRATFAHQQG